VHLLNRTAISTLLPALRELSLNRRPPQREHSIFYTRSTDGVELFCTLMESDPRRAVIVAHPAVVGSYYRQVVDLAEEISASFSAVLFDFRGHGRSSGRCPMGFGAVSRDLEAVVRRVRGLGFEKVGVAGFSLGAAAAFLLASRGVRIDSLVSIGCPPRFPQVSPMVDTTVARAALRLLGMRVQPGIEGGPSPFDVAADLPEIPKFLLFGEWEVAPTGEVEAFIHRVTGPKRILKVPGAWHADLAGREGLVRDWLESTT
jgi:pimeloyl-ACP methyl ester carboxylesterase